jgi:hypothetical protein
MSELRIPGRFSDLDEAWDFANELVEYVWRLERRIAELERFLQDDPDEPVPYELCQQEAPDHRIREILEEYIYLDALEEDIWRSRKCINYHTIMTPANARLYSQLQHTKQGLAGEFREILRNYGHYIEAIAFGRPIYASSGQYRIYWTNDPEDISGLFE